MEREHYIECDELLSRNGEGKADEDGVEDDAKFEDTYRCHLRGVVFHFVRRSVESVDGWFFGGRAGLIIIMVDVVPGVGEVVFARRVTLAD